VVAGGCHADVFRQSKIRNWMTNWPATFSADQLHRFSRSGVESSNQSVEEKKTEAA
jgi:hypothetical protein